MTLLVSADLVQRLGWMLIHSLWQGAAIWLVLEIVLRIARKQSAATRHALACAALALLALAPWVTFAGGEFASQLEPPPANAPSAATPAHEPAGGAPLAAPASNRGVSGSLAIQIRILLPWLVGMWAAGVIVYLFRLWYACGSLRRLARSPLVELSPEWQSRLRALCVRAGVKKPVHAAESAETGVPIVFGWIKPLILLPLGACMRVPAEQVEAILLHELAHIVRNDFATNLLQTICETLFFYHPAVWAISRMIREERELACDDLAVGWCADPVEYAEALTRFEELRPGNLSMAATGGSLLSRVRRILLGESAPQRSMRLFAAAVLAVVIGYLVTMFLVPSLAAKLLSPEERVAAIEAAAKENAALDFSRGKEVVVFGTISTPEGKTPQDRVRITAHSETKHYSEYVSLSAIDGAFRHSMQAGRISLGVWAKGYAPKFMGSFVPSGDSVGPISVVLDKGADLTIRLTGPDGKPVENVSITGSVSDGRPNLQLPLPEMKTNREGEVVLRDLGDGLTLDLKASRKNWQTTEKRLSNVRTGGTETWILQPGIPASGQVIDAVSGAGIEGAEIRLASGASLSGNPIIYGLDDSMDELSLARTDREGRFEIGELSAGFNYRVYVNAKHYELAVESLAAGEKDRKILLQKGLTLAGTIFDPEGLLPKAPESFELVCDLSALVSKHTSHGYRKTLRLQRSGDRTSFSFENLPQGSVGLTIPAMNLIARVNLSGDKKDYVINVGSGGSSSNPALMGEKCTIEFRFLMPDNGASPGGNLAVGYLQNGDRPDVPRVGVEQDVPILNGKATIEVPIPNSLTIRPDHMAGYWFAHKTIKVGADRNFRRAEIPVVPAGAIRGKIIAAGGALSQEYHLSVLAIKRPKALGTSDLTSGGEPARDSDAYVTSPLPFGGTYQLVIWRPPNFTVSRAVTVDEADPVVDLDVERLPGGPWPVRVVDEKGAPVQCSDIMITYVHPGPKSFSGGGFSTDMKGEFVIPNLNFTVPGYYEIEINDEGWESSTTRIDRSKQPAIVVAKKRKP